MSKKQLLSEAGRSLAANMLEKQMKELIEEAIDGVDIDDFLYDLQSQLQDIVDKELKPQIIAEFKKQLKASKDEIITRKAKEMLDRL